MMVQKRGIGFRLRTWLLLVALFAVLFVSISIMVTPENYSLKVGDVVSETILAGREVVDEEATKSQKQSARDAVAQVYSIDTSVSSEIEHDFSAFFSAMGNVRQKAAEMLKPYLDAYAAQSQTGHAPTYLTALKADQWQTLISLCPVQIDKETLNTFLMMDGNAFQDTLDKGKGIVETALKNGISEARLNEEKSSLLSGIDALDLVEPGKQLVKLAAENSLKANAFFDSSATEQARQKAADGVVNVTYKKGQVIIRVGEVVTERHVEMLRNMGMLSGGIVWSVYIGTLLSALFAVGAFGYYLHGEPELARDFRKTLMVCLVMYTIVLLGAFLQRIDLQLVPVTFVAIVLSLTVDTACGVVVGLITGFICASTALASGLEGLTVLAFLTSAWICCYMSAYAISRYPSRSSIVGIGILAGVVGAAIELVIGLLTHTGTQQMVFSMGMEVLSGILSGVLCLGTTPVWESVFKALTPMKLMELCNPTNPLLKRLMYEAPGTYHHSVMVGNLAEAAANAIGANPLLSRVGAYYHDVGKLAAPMFFSENQPQGMQNPHDSLPPIDSARLIMRHPHDSAVYLKEQGIAQPIIDIALQHHGSTPVGYFYHKAKEQDSNTDIRDYRHTGGRPKTLEAAIVMLADSCEAATRAGGDDYQKIMHKIVHERVEDGQLDRVQLTFAQLDTIVDAFASVLRGAYHGRIQYPTDTSTKALRKEGK